MKSFTFTPKTGFNPNGFSEVCEISSGCFKLGKNGVTSEFRPLPLKEDGLKTCELQKRSKLMNDFWEC